MQSIIDKLIVAVEKDIEQYKDWSDRYEDFAQKQLAELTPVLETLKNNPPTTLHEIAKLHYTVKDSLLEILIVKFEELDSIGIFESVVQKRKRKRCLIMT